MDVFDPWTADLEAAKVAQEAFGFDLADPRGPLYQACAAREIEAKRPAIEAGDGFAVLACIRICVTNGLVAPEWLTYAFNRRYDAVLNCRTDSWDSPLAFGRPYRKSAHLAALRKRRTKRLAVWLAIQDIRKQYPDTPIDKGLFERVGQPLGLGATLAEEYYYSAKTMMGF